MLEYSYVNSSAAGWGPWTCRPPPASPLSAVDFETIIAEHARLLSAVARRVCGRRYETLLPDIEQEIRLALWKRLRGDAGDEIRHPASYVYKVALATALTVIRKHGVPAEEPIGDLAEQLRDEAPGYGELLPAERARLVEEVLARLGAEPARALRAYLQGFNHQEVAELFGWTPSVARHHIYRSMEQLRRQLDGDDRERLSTTGRA